MEGKFSNAKILAAVVTEWLRQPILQIAASKVGSLPMMQNLQKTAIGWGLVGGNYNIATDVKPLTEPVVNSLLLPFFESQFSRISDSAIPQMAHGMVDEILNNGGKFSILNGMVDFEEDDILELKGLLDKNLPLNEAENYHVIK